MLGRAIIVPISEIAKYKSVGSTDDADNFESTLPEI
jgi:hypothetical protein